MDEDKAKRIAAREVEVIRGAWVPPWWRKFMRMLWRALGVWFVVGGSFSIVREVIALLAGDGSQDLGITLGVFGGFVVMGILIVRYADRLTNPFDKPQGP